MMREGELDEDYCAIAEGEVVVTGRTVSKRSPGSRAAKVFGEIALIEDVPRTATVTTTKPTEVYRLAKEPLVLALTGHASAKRAASGVVSKRLDELSKAEQDS